MTLCLYAYNATRFYRIHDFTILSHSYIISRLILRSKNSFPRRTKTLMPNLFLQKKKSFQICKCKILSLKFAGPMPMNILNKYILILPHWSD